MTAPIEAWIHAGSTTHPSFSTCELNELRSSLLRGRRRHMAWFVQHAATFARLAHSSNETASMDRAMAALHMYGARSEIEEIEDAVGRIDKGAYGTCLSCNEEMSFASLEARPQSRTCGECFRRDCPPGNSRHAEVGAERNR